MKKRLVILLLAAMFLCGCTPIYDVDENVVQPDIYEETVTPQEPEAVEEKIAEEKPAHTSEILSPENVDELRLRQSGNYAFDNLLPEQQVVYTEILQILQNFEKDLTISLIDPEEIGKIFQCVLNDHPEIFYVEGYTYTKYTENDQVVEITFSGTYTMDQEEASARQVQIDQYVNECLNGISIEATDYEKVKYIYEYIIFHTEYNLEAQDNQNICSVFIGKESVCQGYAKATQYLLNKLGVPTAMVTGTVTQGEGHAWNLSLIEGNYYFIDTTWGDASYQSEETGAEDTWTMNLPSINYDYLCVTTDQLCKTHVIDNVVPLPRCVSWEQNYYVKEDAYFTEYDEARLSSLFQKGYESGSNYITLKCSSKEVYTQMKEQLIEQQNIFKFLQNSDGQVAYADNEVQLSLSFWLTSESF